MESHSLCNHSLEHWKTFQPFRGLKNNRQRGSNVPFVKCAATADRRLIRKRSRSLQAALNRHQPKLIRKIIRVDCRKTPSSPRFKKEQPMRDRKSTRLNSSHVAISYAVFCLKKKNRNAE